MLDALYAAQELQDLFGAQDNRQLLGLLGRRDDVLQTPLPMKCHFVKKMPSPIGVFASRFTSSGGTSLPKNIAFVGRFGYLALCRFAVKSASR